jgi:hypothetical protein
LAALRLEGFHQKYDPGNNQRLLLTSTPGYDLLHPLARQAQLISNGPVSRVGLDRRHYRNVSGHPLRYRAAHLRQRVGNASLVLSQAFRAHRPFAAFPFHLRWKDQPP